MNIEKKYKQIKIIFHIIFVVSIFAMLLCFYKLGNNLDAFSALTNKQYEETDSFANNFISRAQSLNEIIVFQNRYCIDQEINLKKTISGKHTINELITKVNQKDFNTAYNNISDYIYTKNKADMGNDKDDTNIVINNINFSYSDMEKCYQFLHDYSEYLYNYGEFGKDKTNFKYDVAWESIDGINHSISNFDKSKIEKFEYKMTWSKENNFNPTFSAPNINIRTNNYKNNEISNIMIDDLKIKTINVIMGVDGSYNTVDEFSKASMVYKRWTTFYSKLFYISTLLMLISLMVMSVFTGKNENSNIKLYVFDKIPTEISFFSSIIVIVITGVLGLNMSLSNLRIITGYNDYYNYRTGAGTTTYIYSAIGIVFIFICLECSICAYLSLIRRIKSHSLLSNSVCYKVFLSFTTGLSTSLGNKKIGLYIILGFAGYLAITFLGFFIILFFLGSLSIALIFELILQVIALAVVFRFFASYSYICKSINEIANGNITYKINTSKMDSLNIELANDINRISDGLDNAVNASIKNERMKTDLITNVSHDIKTPLTSIINYVGLLKRADIDNKDALHYIDVLEEKSNRLKNLTDDLVEASKLSSGTLKLNKARLNYNELVSQVNGEFEEKFEQKNLSIVCTMPERYIYINGDGQKLWRILENIYNNAYKYSLEGTRVYVDITLENDKVSTNIKNISKTPLNFDISQLTERFIRGDLARSTEGSGLGLSIVKSLVALHDGNINLSLDGDLFKVTIEFNAIK